MIIRIIAISIGLMLGSTGGLAGFPVVDFSNWGQNIFIIYKQIEELTTIKDRINREVNAMKRLAASINKLSSADNIKIRDMINQVNNFRDRVRSIGYNYDSVAHQFDALYGNKDSFSKNYKAWEKQCDDSIKDAMIVQGMVSNSKKHLENLEIVLDAKRDSKGQGQEATLQAIGEINAIQSKQLADLSEIIAADARAKQSVAMEERSKQKDLKNYEAHLMKDFNKHEKSRPLAYFPSLGTTAPRR